MLRPTPGALLLGLGALVGLIAALADYFIRSSGVAYTPGALLVVFSSLALLIAAGILASPWGRGGAIRATMLVLSLLGTAGTAFAAYLLENIWLEAAMVVCLAGWVIHLFWSPAASTPDPSRTEPAQ